MSTDTNPMLNIAIFEEKEFSVKRYIDDLVLQTPPVTVQDRKATSPTSDHDDLLPFITTFETNLRELTKLREDVVSRVSAINKELREEESIAVAISSIADTFEATFGQAEVLEAAFERLGHEPLETGKQLYRLEQQKQRSEHAHKVLEHLELFKKASTSPSLLAAIGKGDEEGREAVKIIRTLTGITDALDGDTVDFVVNIRAFAKSVTTRLQTDFKEALSLVDEEKMAELYALLTLLEWDEECRNLFVQTNMLLAHGHHHVNTKNMHSLYHGDQPVVIRVGREEPEEPLIKDALERLWAACAQGHSQRATNSHSQSTIVNVFQEDADLVVAELIATFVESQLKPMVTECLRQAKQHSPLARQRQLHSIYKQFTGFCARFDDSDTQNSIADAIDLLLQPYLQSIVADEKQCSEDLLKALMANHGGFVARRRGELRRSIMSSPLTTNSPSLPAPRSPLPLLVFTDGKPLVLTDGPEETLSTDTVQRALVLTAEAAGRVMSIVGTGTAEHILPGLLSQLVSIVFSFDVLDVFTQTTDTPPKYGFDPLHFATAQSVHTALTALQLWFERHYGMLAAAVSAGCYAECVRVKSEAMRAAEQRVERFMNLVLDWIVLFAKEYYFKQHKRQDYQGDHSADSATQYCQQLCLYTKRVSVAVRERVEAALADPWLHHLAIRLLHAIMHDLVKRSVVSESGAIALLRDAQAYCTAIPRDTAPNNPHLALLYGACLKDLARLFMVKVEAVRAVVQEGALASVDLKLLLPFVAARADVKSSPRLMNKHFPDYYAGV